MLYLVIDLYQSCHQKRCLGDSRDNSWRIVKKACNHS